MVENFADLSVGAVSGKMNIEEPESGEQADMDLYWRYEIWARRKHSMIGSILGASGCIYVVRRALVDPIAIDTLSDDVTIALRALLMGYRVIFEPRAIAVDFPAVKGTEFRRRWRTLAGLAQAHARYPQVFTRSGRMLWHFLSHKTSRLVLPWVLLTSLAATLALPRSQWRTTLLLLESFVFVLALLDTWVKPGRFKGVTSPVRTFFLMNAASIAAIAVFFLPPQLLWKPTRVAAQESAKRPS